MADYILPLLLFLASAAALSKRENSYDLLLEGAGEGLKMLASLLPALILLLVSVQMLRASGAMELLTGLLAPVLEVLGIPAETAMLVLVRPISGSAALAIAGELMTTYGPDSPVGRTAAVMLGSTETTFYVISVYFAAAGVKRTRYAVPAALCADLAGFIAAAWFARLL